MCTMRACMIESLTPEQKTTVQSAARATSTIAVGIVATTVAAAGAPAVVPMALVLQKAVLYTNVRAPICSTPSPHARHLKRI